MDLLKAYGIRIKFSTYRRMQVIFLFGAILFVLGSAVLRYLGGIWKELNHHQMNEFEFIALVFFLISFWLRSNCEKNLQLSMAIYSILGCYLIARFLLFSLCPCL